MPTPSEANHLTLANKNHDALQHLMSDPQKYAEWIATVAYYKAVQVVEAVLANRGKRSCSHVDRLAQVKKIGRPDLHRHLRAMWAASSVARYLYDNSDKSHYSSFADYIKPESVIHLLVKRRLRPIEQLCLAMLPKECDSELKQIPK